MLKYSFWWLLLLVAGGLNAQQTPRLSQYTFAPGLYNPAAAGTSERLTVGGAFRGQWMGIDGAPSTQVLFLDKARDRVGLGLFLRNDVAGTLGISDLSAAYSYKIPLNAATVLRGGLSVSMANWRNDFSKLRLDDLDDPQFLVNVNRWLPNFGAGVQIEHTRGQLGFGMPQLFEYNLNDGVDAVAARTFRPCFVQASGNLYLNNKQLRLQPQVVLASATLFNGARKAPRNNIGAPNALDLGITATIEEQWKGGIQWRTALERRLSSDHALGIMAGWTGAQGFSISGVYEIPLNAIRRVTDASFEIMLTYAIAPRPQKTISPTSTVVPPPPVVVPTPPTPTTPRPKAPVEPAPEEVVLTVKGIIIDMKTGLPAESARITLTNTCNGAETPAFITTANGVYTFSLSNNCCYTVTAQKDGRKTAISEEICTNNTTKPRTFRADLDLLQL
jgi:type IX secretion system PorP/SprF family membrane protein